MSGAEVLGLISGITAILDAATKVFNAARDASGLPSNFRVVARRLPLIMDTLRMIQDGLEFSANQDSYVAMKLVLEGCKKKATSLENIFRVIVPASSASGPRRVAAAMRTLGKGKRIETLMKGIVDDLQLLTGNHALKATTRRQIPELTKTINSSTTGLVGQRSMSMISNYGIGLQSIHLGEGDQNINTGGGPQFNGTFTGAFNFSAPATPLYGSDKE